MKKINQTNQSKKTANRPNSGKPITPWHDLKTPKDPRGGEGRTRQVDGFICTNHNELFAT